jgi:hypothetical protein
VYSFIASLANKKVVGIYIARFACIHIDQGKTGKRGVGAVA